MRIIFLALIGMLSVGGVSGQDEVKLFSEREGDVVTIYADNPAVIPMTVDLELDLTNMKTDFGSDKGQFVIPGKSSRFEVAKLTNTTQYGRTGMRLQSLVYVGDISKTPDKNYVYDLPFESGASFLVSQGYNGRFSHHGENAIDFNLDIGDKVYAARGGVVYNVVDQHSKSCRNSSCQQFNNHITIYHEDGTFSEYSHLNHKGSNVQIGDQVEKGDFLGYSGNTGWSSGPHLHFVVYKYTSSGERKTLKTKFATKNKSETMLKENSVYTK